MKLQMKLPHDLCSRDEADMTNTFLYNWGCLQVFPPGNYSGTQILTSLISWSVQLADDSLNDSLKVCHLMFGAVLWEFGRAPVIISFHSNKMRALTAAVFPSQFVNQQLEGHHILFAAASLSVLLACFKSQRGGHAFNDLFFFCVHVAFKPRIHGIDGGCSLSTRPDQSGV